MSIGHCRLLAAGLAATLLAAPVAARADWRDEIKVLRVGVMTGANSAYRLAQLEPFRAYLEARLAVPVEIMPAQDYRALIEAQAGSRIHYAIYSATAFATAAASCRCVEPLVVPARADGEVGFYALLVARADGPIRSLADAKGKRLALAGADSVAGRLLPMKAFEEEGIVPSEYFSAVVDEADPELAISALLAGDADLAVAWSSLTGDRSAGYRFGALTALVAEGGLSMDQIRLVWQSPLVPFGPHAIRSDLPADLKPLVLDALVAMASESPAALDAVDRFGGSGFVAADAGLYAPIEALVAPPAAAQ
jgi:phosphonate transport system substrate-binding protein